MFPEHATGKGAANRMGATLASWTKSIGWTGTACVIVCAPSTVTAASIRPSSCPLNSAAVPHPTTASTSNSLAVSI